jgi:hypothetical protein
MLAPFALQVFLPLPLGASGSEGLGRSVPPMRTLTPASPVEGEGPAQCLTTTFVPNSIVSPQGRGSYGPSEVRRRRGTLESVDSATLPGEYYESG